MNCPKCQNQNEENASYCRNCGSSLHNIYNEPVKENTAGDVLILITIIFMVINRIYYVFIPKFVEEWWTTMKIPNTILNLIWGFIPIALAIAVRNKTMKIVLLVVGGLYLIYNLYENIAQLID